MGPSGGTQISPPGSARSERTPGWDRMISKAERVAGLVLLLIASGYLYAGRDMDWWRGQTVGPRLFPFLLGVSLATVAFLILVATFRGQPKSSAPIFGQRLPMLVTLCTAAYIWLLPVVGYAIANTALMLTCLRLYDPHRWWIDALGAAGVTLALYLVFVVILRLQLPLGMLGG